MSPILRLSGLEPQNKDKQADVRCQAKCSQDGHNISARSELLSVQSILAYFGEELLVPCRLLGLLLIDTLLALLALLAAEQACEQYTYAVHSKQCADRVKFSREYLEHNERKGELSECSSYVCSFKCPLSCTDLDQLRSRQHYRACSMEA